MLLAAVLGANCVRGTDGDPKKSMTRLDLAKDFLGKNELEAAEAEANRAIGFWRDNDEAYVVRGTIAFLRAFNDHRLLELDSCLSGVDAEALENDRDEHYAKAEGDFARAGVISPDYGEAWSLRGTIANLTGAHEDAVRYLHTALSNPARLQNPGLTRAHLGWAYFHLSDHVRAAKELRQAVQFQPGMCVATYRLGRVYFAREEWEKASEQFEEVGAQAPCNSQEASYYLMKTRIKQGLSDDAKKARDACLAASPSSCLAAQCRLEGRALGSLEGTRQ
jgi:tetratricopeptide (TPR) repeat protein